MNTLRSQIIVLCPRHETLANPLIHHKHNLSRDLRSQKSCLLHPHFLPLGKVIWHFDQFDARGRLRMARVLVRLLHLLLVVLLELELLMQLLL